MEKTMLDILKARLVDGLEITKVKESASKYTITFTFEGCEATTDLRKSCPPGAHNTVADFVISTAMAHIYSDKGDFAKAGEWLDKIGK